MKLYNPYFSTVFYNSAVHLQGMDNQVTDVNIYISSS